MKPSLPTLSISLMTVFLLPLQAETVLFDVDLTRNDPGGGLVSSGWCAGGAALKSTEIHPTHLHTENKKDPEGILHEVPARNLDKVDPEGPAEFLNDFEDSYRWNNGFEILKSGEPGGKASARIVYDLGRPIQNGYAEISFTLEKMPAGPKTNFFGIFEYWTLSHKHGGSIAYLRQGHDPNGKHYGFAMLKACDVAMLSNGDAERRLGQKEDLVADGKTINTVRITWQDGKVTVSGPGMDPVQADKRGRAALGPWSFGNIRWVYLGSDGFYGRALVGQKFTHIKIVEL